MRRSNPEPVFLTTNSFALSGAGIQYYTFSFENQCVIKLCYTRYNVVLHFSSLFSNGYIVLLQNGISHAYMCGCVQARAYTRASVRECLCYIATNDFKSLKRKVKSVVGRCSLAVVWPCYAGNNKILGINSAENGGAGLDGAEVPVLPAAGERDGLAVRAETPRNGAGRVVRTVAGGVPADDLQVFKKWRISAVFGKAFNAAFNVRASNVIQKAQVSAVFRAVRTFFLKMFTGAETDRGGDPPKTAASIVDMSGTDFFSISGPDFFLTAGEAGRLFFHGHSGFKGNGSLGYEQNQESGR